jgi:hypothetical protein
MQSREFSRLISKQFDTRSGLRAREKWSAPRIGKEGSSKLCALKMYDAADLSESPNCATTA